MKIGSVVGKHNMTILLLRNEKIEHVVGKYSDPQRWLLGAVASKHGYPITLPGNTIAEQSPRAPLIII